MNDNRFDHGQDENKAPEYEVYSREYKPNGDQYHEYSYVYSHDPSHSRDGKKRKNSGVGKAIALIALAILLALTIFSVGIFIAARIIFPNTDLPASDDRSEQNTQISGGDETEAPQKTPANQEVFFGSEEETETEIDIEDIRTERVDGERFAFRFSHTLEAGTYVLTFKVNGVSFEEMFIIA